MGNAKAIDILAEKDGHQFIIQVKAIFKKKNVGCQ
jgi:predicted RecB family endonuclease